MDRLLGTPLRAACSSGANLEIVRTAFGQLRGIVLEANGKREGDSVALIVGLRPTILPRRSCFQHFLRVQTYVSLRPPNPPAPPSLLSATAVLIVVASVACGLHVYNNTSVMDLKIRIGLRPSIDIVLALQASTR